MSCAAQYVEEKMGFADSTALIVREDWEHLSAPAVAAGKQEILDMLSDSGASRITLIHATGTSEGLSMMTDVLDEEGIDYAVAPNADVIGEAEMIKWAEETVNETLNYIQEERPTESATTPYWERTYACEADPNQATVTGTVFTDANGNGMLDAGEQGISGLRMLAIDYMTGDIMEALTAADGTYSFVVPPAPAATLIQTAEYPTGQMPTGPWFTYLVPEKDSVTTFDIGFS